jgi:AcrR family transcriptional regulator
VLAEIAFAPTRAGEASARVLLSVFDAWHWGLTAGDLARLDERSLAAALAVLHHRAYLGPPPQGAEPTDTTSDAYFDALARHWWPTAAASTIDDTGDSQAQSRAWSANES